MSWISIGEICNKHVEYVTPETTALRAAQRMRELHLGDLVIVDETAAESAAFRSSAAAARWSGS